MRHRKHRYQLGVKKEHRKALMAALAGSLFLHNRIKTTLAKAKALRPFAEKIITLAKKAAQTDDKAKKLHYYRLALAKVRMEEPVAVLFTKRAKEFLSRQGGYTRIYKLAIPRVGDAAPMALIELIAADDEGYKKVSKKPKAKKAAPAAAPTEPAGTSAEPAPASETKTEEVSASS
ncbi:MAG: 50S ribosomal protein L17 [Opitutae bacterium]|nr:50S ribosomal protein L17 [Opitutae bacterium]